MMDLFQIKVPGSTANLGPGFDSIGVSLSLYLTLRVKRQQEWQFVHIGQNVPEDTSVENHLIYKIAKQVAAQFQQALPSCHIEMESELPLARGLGSSAAAIVAAIELANVLCQLQLTTEQKLTIASIIEGHPDNATASILGGVTISSLQNEIVDTIHIPSFDCKFVVIIPDFELKTADARAVLPATYEKAYAVRASAQANMLTAALLAKDYERVGKYMEEDYFHEPFRAKLISAFYEIKSAAKQFGAYGTALSGAGPTLISLVANEQAETFAQQMQKHYPQHTVVVTKADEHGVVVSERPLPTSR